MTAQALHRMTLLLSPVSHATGPGTREKLSWEHEAWGSVPQLVSEFDVLLFFKFCVEDWSGELDDLCPVREVLVG